LGSQTFLFGELLRFFLFFPLFVPARPFRCRQLFSSRNFFSLPFFPSPYLPGRDEIFSFYSNPFFSMKRRNSTLSLRTGPSKHGCHRRSSPQLFAPQAQKVESLLQVSLVTKKTPPTQISVLQIRLSSFSEFVCWVYQTNPSSS